MREYFGYSRTTRTKSRIPCRSQPIAGLAGTICAIFASASMADPCPAKDIAIASQPPPSKTVAKPQRPATAESEYRNLRVLSPMQLPDVPQYPGRARLLNGFHYPNESGGQSIMEVFAVAEEPAQVYQWYRDALKNFGWTLIQTQGLAANDGQMIDASKQTNNVAVQVKTSRDRSFRTELTIKCKVGKAM